MLRKFSILLLLSISLIFTAFLVSSCGKDSPLGILDKSSDNVNQDLPEIGKNDSTPSNQKAAYWGNRIVSEAFYSLNRWRTGTSNAVYAGLAFSDWSYVESDRGALDKITWWIGGYGNRGIIGRDSHGFERGGYCRFFVNLILYRSSYGYYLGHLVLPRSGWPNKNHSVYSAAPGWVIYTTGPVPHWAIVVKNLGWGLDVIDSNYKHPSWWIKSGWKWDYGFYICRHPFSWQELISKGYRAYCPWEAPLIIH